MSMSSALWMRYIELRLAWKWRRRTSWPRPASFDLPIRHFNSTSSDAARLYNGTQACWEDAVIEQRLGFDLVVGFSSAGNCPSKQTGPDSTSAAACGPDVARGARRRQHNLPPPRSQCKGSEGQTGRGTSGPARARRSWALAS